jgi:hypothetical protein
LELQISATYSQIVERFEVAVGSQIDDTSSIAALKVTKYRTEPRDIQAAAFSYDGRESLDVLHTLTTLPIPATCPHRLPPAVHAMPDVGVSHGYLEMVQPNDCARRIIGVNASFGNSSPRRVSIRYGLFGHDLEKGVVLRGRVRGIWLPHLPSEEEIRRLHEVFLREPPTLGS